MPRKVTIENKLVSIVVPVYNAGGFLRDSLQSICNQTYRDLEIIMVNDCSEDDSLNIINEFLNADDRIKLIKNTGRLGAGASRNTGSKHISGKYSIFLDADDTYEPEMIETMVNKAEEHSLDMVVCRCDYCYKKGNRLLYLPYRFSINDSCVLKNDVCKMKDINENIFGIFAGWAWDKLIRTDIFKKNDIRFQEIRSSNDMSFVFSCLLKCDRIGVADRILVHHIKTSGTVSTTREHNWRCFIEALEGLKAFLHKHDLYDRYERDFVNYALHFSLWNYLSLKEPARRELYEDLKENRFDEFSISGRNRAYFYSKAEYRQMMNIQNGRYISDPSFVRYYLKITERIRRYGIISFVYEQIIEFIKYSIINIKQGFEKRRIS